MTPLATSLLSSREIQALSPKVRKQYGTMLMNLGTKIMTNIKKDNFFLNGDSMIWHPTIVRRTFELEGLPEDLPMNSIRYYLEVEMHLSEREIDDSEESLKKLCKKIYRRSKGLNFEFYDDFRW